MHVHILGICGTFMGSLAIIARQLGHAVSGSDTNVYPPMSTQLEMAGIGIMEGYSVDHLHPMPDQIIVGNVMTRGNQVLEYLLNNHLPFTSGPAWLHDHVLQDRRVLAVAGTHGKTTVSSMLAWILEYAGLEPGFLIGGVPENFEHSSRLGKSELFVIEADEYDTAFFDKRSKFLHYCPHTLILNNLEFDHADIFDGVGDIKRQFHHLVRIMPGEGRVIVNHDDRNIRDVLDMGCWTTVESFSVDDASATWFADRINLRTSQFSLQKQGKSCGSALLGAPGRHNIANAVAAVAGAVHAGVRVEDALQALASFSGVKRRLEHIGTFGSIGVYDDFAHHPTEIAATISAFREQQPPGRIVAVFEPRSNTMRLGVHAEQLVHAFGDADRVVMLEPDSLQWSIRDVADRVDPPAQVCTTVDAIITLLLNEVQEGDSILLLSNGSFEGLSDRLVSQLCRRESSAVH
ncbi:MAG: UDP-N-acetylmuramate:L-alanyl-gamma-D-glutamyl-meso-diaminopimelate ligase [Gammaproteobacteria bacterium]|nr:UDP-N-acetylmuramate:L-alanyl-gamma-D-glutamyl-meso-diaminopimelate ligase [Gammaproteobacteria bacterium]